MRLGRLDIPKSAELPEEGIAFWDNPGNSFTILAIHYTADPNKRGAEWLQENKQGYNVKDWDQEYELSFATWIGRPVYLLFDKERHVAKAPLQYSPGHPMQRWWDLGTHACVWAQRVDRQLRIYHSLQVVGAFGPREHRYQKWEVDVSGLGSFIEYCIGESDDLFPDVRAWRDILDPSAFNRTVTKEFAPSRIFTDHNLKPVPGETQNQDVRIADVEDWMVYQNLQEPGLVIDPSAKVIIDGFAGGYVLMKEGTSAKPDNQSGYAHVHCAIQYGASKNRVLHMKRNVQREIAQRLDPASHDVSKYTNRARRSSDHWLSY